MIFCFFLLFLDGIQSFEQFAPVIKNEVHAHAAHLINAQNLRYNLLSASTISIYS